MEVQRPMGSRLRHTEIRRPMVIQALPRRPLQPVPERRLRELVKRPQETKTHQQALRPQLLHPRRLKALPLLQVKAALALREERKRKRTDSERNWNRCSTWLSTSVLTSST